jgi:hypothetical protein
LYAQINKDFLILTHIGLNSLNSNTMSPTGTGEGSQVFLHAWAQYSLVKNNAVGGGLHYWNGISRLNNQHFKFNDIRQPKASLGYLGSIRSICRHRGLRKGSFKLQYRVSMNGAATNNLQATTVPTNGGAATYTGRRLLGSKEGQNLCRIF